MKCKWLQTRKRHAGMHYKQVLGSFHYKISFKIGGGGGGGSKKSEGFHDGPNDT
jgi:hypothetical protein